MMRIMKKYSILLMSIVVDDEDYEKIFDIIDEY